MSSGYVTVSQAAAMRGVSEWTIRRLIKDGHLPAYRIHGRPPRNGARDNRPQWIKRTDIENDTLFFEGAA